MRRLISLSLLLVFLLLSAELSGQRPDTARIMKDIRILASDSLQGRKPGTLQCNQAAEYILNAFVQTGLKPAGDNGYQEFDVTTDIEAGPGNILKFRSVNLTMGEDFTPFSFSSNAELTAPVVFAGYGFDFETDSLRWNDYEGLDVRGRWVMILRGHPDPDNEDAVYVPFAKERTKVMVAKDKGAAGVLFVTGMKWDRNDALVNLFYDKSKSGSGIPVIHIKRSLADSILSKSAKNIAGLEAELNQSRKALKLPVLEELRAAVDLKFTTVKTRNVMALLSGNPTHQNPYIIVGAHYDHLGWGGNGSGSRMPDTSAVHNGADDNASGVAAMLELARILSFSKAGLNNNILFIAFSAEEMGLLGSIHYVDHPLVPREKVRLMVNFDMVGRMKNGQPAISVGGTGTFEGAEELLGDLMKERTFKANYSPEGYGPSDHAPFYADSIPVLYFNTGAHQDYHTPYDDADLINTGGIALITDLVADLIATLDRKGEALTFLEAGPRAKTRHGGALRVRLGIMPDFANTEVAGVAVGGVSKGGPAEHGGILKGDVITALNGKTVQNIYEYMDRLRTFSPGQTITVDILRGEQKLVLLIQL